MMSWVDAINGAIQKRESLWHTCTGNPPTLVRMHYYLDIAHQRHAHPRTHVHTHTHTHCEYTHMHTCTDACTDTPHTSTCDGKMCNSPIILVPCILLYLSLMGALQKEAHLVSNA